jgi:chromate reductase
MRILGISGSLRAGSHNTALLRAVGELLPAGVELELFGALEAIPPYNEDRDGHEPPAAAARLREAIAAADVVLFATPEYNGSVPGGLKNAVDWASRPARQGVLSGKTTGVVGASTGAYGALWAQMELRKTLGVAGARVLGADLPVPRAHEAFDDAGRLSDPALAERLQRHLEALVELSQPATVAA